MRRLKAAGRAVLFNSELSGCPNCTYTAHIDELRAPSAPTSDPGYILENTGSPSRTRTCDHSINSRMDALSAA